MKYHFTPRSAALIAALAAAIALACWVLRPYDDLSHLKRTVEVTDGTEDAVAAVRGIIRAAGSPDARRELAKYMYVADRTEQERITAPMWSSFWAVTVRVPRLSVASSRAMSFSPLAAANRTNWSYCALGVKLIAIFSLLLVTCLPCLRSYIANVTINPTFCQDRLRRGPQFGRISLQEKRPTVTTQGKD